jgi:hypothetical protein
MTAIDFSNLIYTMGDIDGITDILEVAHPHAISCELDLVARTATIPRLELKLRGNRPIAAGWTAQIAIVQGINRRFTLRDGMTLPMIAPAGAIERGNSLPAVEGGIAIIPHDIVASDDKWALEWYIVDPLQNRELLYRSPAVSFR